jgi:hypothetical protein
MLDVDANQSIVKLRITLNKLHCSELEGWVEALLQELIRNYVARWTYMITSLALQHSKRENAKSEVIELQTIHGGWTCSL